MKPGNLVPRVTSLLDQLREPMRYLHYSRRCRESRLYWVRFFLTGNIPSAQSNARLRRDPLGKLQKVGMASAHGFDMRANCAVGRP